MPPRLPLLLILQNQRRSTIGFLYVSCLVEFLIRSVCCWMACWTTALGSARWGRLRENSWSKRYCEDGKVCSRGGKDCLQLQRARLPLFCCSPSSYRCNGAEVTTSCHEQNKASVYLTSILFVNKWIRQQPRVTPGIFLFSSTVHLFHTISLSHQIDSSVCSDINHEAFKPVFSTFTLLLVDMTLPLNLKVWWESRHGCLIFNFCGWVD